MRDVQSSMNDVWLTEKISFTKDFGGLLLLSFLEYRMKYCNYNNNDNLPKHF